LCNDETDLELEMVSLSKLLKSIMFNTEEKEAVINGDLRTYLQRSELQEIT
jgi:hypothetical protein